MISMLEVKKHVKKVKKEENVKERKTERKQYFHSANFPLDFFNDDFFAIAIKETTRGFLEEN